jgi:hypothetical protein
VVTRYHNWEERYHVDLIEVAHLASIVREVFVSPKGNVIQITIVQREIFAIMDDVKNVGMIITVPLVVLARMVVVV